MSENNYTALAKIDVSKYVEKKQNLSYLSWPFAVDQLMRKDYEYRFQAAGVSAVVCTGRGSISLGGSGLRLVAMNKNELLVSGKLQSVEWE